VEHQKFCCTEELRCEPKGITRFVLEKETIIETFTDCIPRFGLSRPKSDDCEYE
jgi:hypothetical protein